MPWDDRVDRDEASSSSAYLIESLQAYELYLKEKKYPDAMRVALRINERDLTEQCFAACEDPLEKQQLAYLLARQVRPDLWPPG